MNVQGGRVVTDGVSGYARVISHHSTQLDAVDLWVWLRHHFKESSAYQILQDVDRRLVVQVITSRSYFVTRTSEVTYAVTEGGAA